MLPVQWGDAVTDKASINTLHMRLLTATARSLRVTATFPTFKQDTLNYTGRPDSAKIPRAIYSCHLEFVTPRGGGEPGGGPGGVALDLGDKL